MFFRLLALLLILSGSVFGQGFEARSLGWRYDPEAADELAKSVDPLYVQQLRVLGDDADPSKEMLLYRYLSLAMKEAGQENRDYVSENGTIIILPRNQGRTGSCVGNGSAGGIDLLQAVRIHGLEKPERWVKANADLIYAIGRHAGNYFSADGSTGAWSVKGMSELGTLFQLEYGFGDFTKESDVISKRMGSRPLGREFLEEAAKHKLLSYARVNGVNECIGAVQNGFPVIICSRVGFVNNGNGQTVRGDGRYKVVSSAELASANARGSWAHCMLVIAYSDGHFLILNSWGAENRRNGSGWVVGPIYPDDQPYGSFWCDLRTMAKILSDRDSWALSGIEGFEGEPRVIDWRKVLNVGK